MFQVDARDPDRQAAPKPPWWLLYSIGALMLGAVGLLERYVPDGPVRTVLECAAVVGAFGLMLFWRRCNRARFDVVGSAPRRRRYYA